VVDAGGMIGVVGTDGKLGAEDTGAPATGVVATGVVGAEGVAPECPTGDFGRGAGVRLLVPRVLVPRVAWKVDLRFLAEHRRFALRRAHVTRTECDFVALCTGDAVVGGAITAAMTSAASS
jgi:hypothetical protein